MELALATKPELVLNSANKKDFYLKHIFHERHMNSCPIGCEGCAVSASTTKKGGINFSSLEHLYKEAKSFGVPLSITKVEGYDPAFVQYSDNPEIPFASSVMAAIDNGHKIITPICTTGSWKSERTKWQMEELGKLESKYRRYTYPSGKSGEAIVLSVPREINPFAGGKKYDFEMHVDKILGDSIRLSNQGRVDVLVYFNSKVSGDTDIANAIISRLDEQLSVNDKTKVALIATDFNTDNLPESCYRYENIIIISDQGFTPIDPVTMSWGI
jgi:hypothetical protein